MPYFTKKPVTIEARQFDGTRESVDQIICWMQDSGSDRNAFMAKDDCVGTVFVIPTLEGNHRANTGDWIIKGVKGEFYPCKPDIFKQTYEPASEENQ
jgi:hypothetical protein